MKKILPAEIVLKDYRKQYKCLHRNLLEWSQENYQMLCELPKAPKNVQELRDAHDQQLEALIVDYATWGTIKTFGNIRSSPSVQIFTELSRTFFLIMYQTIKAEEMQVHGKSSIPKDLWIGYSLDQSEHLEGDFNLDWKKRIINYSQQDVMNGLLMLSQKVDQLPHSAVEEIEKILRLLYLRNSIFLCESSTECILNVPGMTAKVEECLIPNRHYITFCSIYVHAIERRLFYYRQIQCVNVPDVITPDMIARVEQWVQDITNGLGTEGFEDCYGKSCEEGYQFPGDREWFKYRYPDQPAHTGAILDCFRRTFAQSYYVEYRMSKESVLAAVNQASHTGHCARIFVLNVVNQYLKTHYNVPWRDGLVIDNKDLEGSQVKLFRNQAPFFLQLFSRHCVYNDRTFYPSDCMYQSLAIWLYLCKTHCDSQIFGVSIKPLIDKIVDNAQKKTFVAEF